MLLDTCIYVVLKICQKEGWIMVIGLPKEVKNNEFRVGLTPSNVRDYYFREKS